MKPSLPNDNSTPPSSSAAAAATIQAAYRSSVVRNLIKKISSVKSKLDTIEKLIQRQETVDALTSSDQKEKLKINEELMRLLLDLDSVPGSDPSVRDLRRSLSRRIVGVQEVVDGICRSERINGWDGMTMMMTWDDVIGRIEEQVCNDRGGGEELERFCARHLGFRCFERFLHNV